MAQGEILGSPLTLRELVTLLVAIFFGTLAAIQTYRAYRLTKRVATAQGVFTRPEVEISLFGDRVIENFVLAVPLSREKKRVIEIPLMFGIGNYGEKTAEDVQTFFTLSKDLLYGGKFTYNLRGAKLDGISITTVAKTKNLQTVAVTIQSLHPKVRIPFQLGVSVFNETFIESEVTVRTADGVDLSIPYSLEFAYRIDTVLVQRNQNPVTKSFHIQIFDTTEQSIKQALAAYNQRKERDESKAPPEILGRAMVVELSKESLVSDPKLNIDRPAEEAAYTICNGFLTTRGFVFPALRVDTRPPFIDEKSNDQR